MRQSRWLAVLLCPLMGCVCGRTEERTYVAGGGVPLRYVVAYPDGDAPAPLWIFQPGDGTLRDGFDAHGAAVLASSVALGQRVVFVFPELRRQHFSGDMASYCALDFFHRIDDLHALTDDAKTLPGVDPERLFFVGHSAGAEIVTLTSVQRADVRGVATYGGGTASAGELEQLPENFERMLANDCSSPARQWLRQGTFWQQLFVDSQLFHSIQQVDRPYLALIGERDETVRWADHEATGRQLEELEPTFRLESLRGGTHSLISDPWPRIAAFFAGE
ncbi:MAG: dienelactone hydrolase family protein [Myxococcota bacterium]